MLAERTEPTRDNLLFGITSLSIILVFFLDFRARRTAKPWFSSPFWLRGSIPSDVSPECSASIKLPNQGDFKSMLCQARLNSPYTADPPSTQSPFLLWLHSIVDRFGLSPSFAVLSLILIAVVARTVRSSSSDHRTLLSVFVLCAIFAVDRGNFAYIPITLLAAHVATLAPSPSHPTSASFRLWMALSIGLCLALKPGMFAICFLLLLLNDRDFVRTFLGAICTFLFLTSIPISSGFGVAEYIHVLRSNSGPTVFYPSILYHFNPTELITITEILFSFTPTNLMKLALITPLAVLSFERVARPGRSSRHTRHGHLIDSSKGPGIQSISPSVACLSSSVACLLYVSGTGASYQVGPALAVLSLGAQCSAMRVRRLIVVQYVAIVLASIGIHRALITETVDNAFYVQLGLGCIIIFCPMLILFTSLSVRLER